MWCGTNNPWGGVPWIFDGGGDRSRRLHGLGVYTALAAAALQSFYASHWSPTGILVK